MAEDQGRRTEKSTSTLEQSDLKIRKSKETQEKVARRLISTILENSGVSSPRSLEDSSVNREIARIKDDLRDCEDDSKQNMRKSQIHTTMLEDMERDIRDLATKFMTRSAMTDYESKLAHLTVNLQKLQNLFSQHENAFAQLPHMQDLVDKVKGLLLQFYQDKDDLSVRIDQQKSRLDEQIVQSDQQITQLNKLKDEEQGHHEALKKSVQDQMEEVRRLKFEVIGDPELKAKGIIEVMTGDRDRIEKIEGAMHEFDNEMEKFSNRVFKVESEMLTKVASAKLESDFDGLKKRSENLETSVLLLQEKDSESVVNAGNVLGDKMDLTEPMIKVHDRLRNLEERVEQSERDALEKDDMVSSEVDRIEQLVTRQEEEINRLREQISALRSEITTTAAAPVISRPLPPPSPVNSLPTVDESLVQRILALENDLKEFKDPITNRTNIIEVLVESLQQRFDNLSTEHLATAIIHQMQILYPPHPANIQNELAHTKNRLNAIDQNIPILWGEIPKFHARIEQVAHMTPNLRTELMEFIERKFKNNTAKSGSHDYSEMEGRVSNLVNDSHGRFLEAEQKFADFTKDSAESVDNLRHTFEELKMSVEAQFVQLTDVLNDVTALRAENVSNMTSVNENLRDMEVRLQSREEDLLKELPSIHADIALLNQHTQIRNPTVLAAVAAAQQQEEQTGEQEWRRLEEVEEAERSASVAEGAIVAKQRRSTSGHSTPLATGPKNSLSQPTNHNNNNTNNNVEQSPGALLPNEESSPKHSPPPQQLAILKRSRLSDIQDSQDDAQDDSSQDVRPMKIQRRKGSYNPNRRDRDQESQGATPPFSTAPMRRDSSSRSSEN